jgi:hypothetical protein
LGGAANSIFQGIAARWRYPVQDPQQRRLRPPALAPAMPAARIVAIVLAVWTNHLKAPHLNLGPMNQVAERNLISFTPGTTTLRLVMAPAIINYYEWFTFVRVR